MLMNKNSGPSNGEAKLQYGPSGFRVLRPGSRADVQVLDAPSVTHLAYRPGVPLTHAVWRAGVRVR